MEDTYLLKRFNVKRKIEHPGFFNQSINVTILNSIPDLNIV